MALDEAAIQGLLDRAAISDVLHTYATAVDSRDWGLFRSIFTDPVHVDFRSFHPSINRAYALDELVGMTKLIAGFDSTQHLSTNHRHEIAGDRATCVSYMHAGHFLRREGKEHACFLYGFYTYGLARTDGGWKVDRYGLEITAQHGDPRVFEWVGMR